MTASHRAAGATLFALLSLGASATAAHFQLLLPSSESLGDGAPPRLALELRFIHPMAGGTPMAIERPRRFGVVVDGETIDLGSALEPRATGGAQGFRADYAVRTPGDHLFFVEPAPYWEPAERKTIVHYTKVIVDAYAGTERWHQPIGLPVEIVPLTRPYGLWTGNLVRGVVLYDGAPAAGATVEIEWLNDGSLAVPDAPYRTQHVRTDTNGIFAYALPRAGWWGFAALIDGEQPLAGPDGRPAPVELGGLLWVRARDMD